MALPQKGTERQLEGGRHDGGGLNFWSSVRRLVSSPTLFSSCVMLKGFEHLCLLSWNVMGFANKRSHGHVTFLLNMMCKNSTCIKISVPYASVSWT